MPLMFEELRETVYFDIKSQRGPMLLTGVFSADFGCKSYRNLVSCSKKAACCHLLQILGNIGERGLLVCIINDISQYWQIFTLHTFLLRYAQQDDSLPMIPVIDPGDDLD